MNTRKKIGALAMTLMMLFTVTACGGEAAETADDGGSSGEAVTLLCANAAAPDQAVTVALENFVEVVKERTGGEVIIDLQSNGALGSEEDTVESAMMGTIDLVVTGSAAVSGTIPQYCVCDFPFAFETPEDAYAFYDGDFGQQLFDIAAEYGLIGLAYAENGFRNMTNNVRGIHTPDDMKGLKMRTQSAQIYMDMMNALGATATPIPYGELYSALQQKTVDGQENPIGNIFSARLYEVQKYITLDRHTYDSNIIFLSAESLNKLTDEQYEILKTAAYECAVESREINNANEASWMEQMEAEGVIITELTSQEHELFVEATKDVYKNFVDIVGEDVVNAYLQAIGRA